jgi:hypothetical protein
VKKLIVGGIMNEDSKKTVDVDDVSFAIEFCKKVMVLARYELFSLAACEHRVMLTQCYND